MIWIVIFSGVVYFLDKIGYISGNFSSWGYIFLLGAVSLVITLLLRWGCRSLWYYRPYRRAKKGRNNNALF